MRFSWKSIRKGLQTAGLIVACAAAFHGPQASHAQYPMQPGAAAGGRAPMGPAAPNPRPVLPTPMRDIPAQPMPMGNGQRSLPPAYQNPTASMPDSEPVENEPSPACRQRHVPPYYGNPEGGRNACVQGVDSSACGADGEPGWEQMSPMEFDRYGQGEYSGHERAPHLAQYRLRVDDQISLIYLLIREPSNKPYKLHVGDEIRVESFTDEKLNDNLVIQPDGTITLRLLNQQVRAAGKTVMQLREELQQRFVKFYKIPAISVIPLKVNTRLEDIRNTVDARAGVGGQSITMRITPEGSISLPAIGTVPVQGLSLEECADEINCRYAEKVEGLQVTAVLVARAPRHIYVYGEVKTPGRFVMEGPMTSIQALAMAGGANHGGNLRQVVVMRRADDWRLIATMLDLRGALYGKRPAPSDEIFLNDSDVVIVPKSPILVADDWIDLIFTRGLYRILPFQSSFSYSKVSQL